eukprot:1445401-Amphidinium_carterae.1
MSPNMVGKATSTWWRSLRCAPRTNSQQATSQDFNSDSLWLEAHVAHGLGYVTLPKLHHHCATSTVTARL